MRSWLGMIMIGLLLSLAAVTGCQQAGETPVRKPLGVPDTIIDTVIDTDTGMINVRKEIYQNGRLRRQYSYIVDSTGTEHIHGEEKLWYPWGTPKKVTHKVYGKQSGKTTVWYEDGTKEEESGFKDGHLHGRLRRWNEDGILILEEHYVDDLKQGRQRLWDSTGMIVEERIWKDNKIQSKKEF